MKPQVVKVKITLHFVGVLPSGGHYSTPEEAVKQKFRMIDAGVAGFVETGREMIVSAKEVELPNEPTV